jgi:cell division control protein 6
VQVSILHISTGNEADSQLDENEHPVEVTTPSATRFKDALANASPGTPKLRVKLTGKPLTPRTPRNLSTPATKTPTVYALARDLFTQSTSPRKLIGRDTERAQLQSFISDAILLKKGGCTYISGPPGTGKSALIDEVFAEFKSDPSIKVASINCVAIKSAKEVYGKLVQDFGLDGLTVHASDKDQLCRMFIPKQKSASATYLISLDEIDSLLDGGCEVLYNLFEWALHHSSRLILIGIANALDLTDRFLPRLKARNLKPQLLPFLPYTAAQIASIITKMLRSVLPVDSNAAPDFVPFLHPAAIQLSSKKVASQTGDLRKVFSLVRRAIDQVERETVEEAVASVDLGPVKQPLREISNLLTTLPPSPPKCSPLKPLSPQFLDTPPALNTLTPETAPRATVAHVARLASSIFNNGTATRLAGLNLQQKAVLCSLIAAERKKADIDPFTTPTKSASKAPAVKDLYAKYSSLCSRDEGILQPLRSTEFRDVVTSLETLGLVQESTRRTTSFLTPTKTPSRLGRNPDERQIVSAVSEKEMIDSLKGVGADLLQRLMHER